MRSIGRHAEVLILLVFFGVSLPKAVQAQETAAPPYSLGAPEFHLNKLTPDMPFDVDIEALRHLSTTPKKEHPPFDVSASNGPYAQRLFDVFSWRMFCALNWPATADGQADPSKTLQDATTPRVWEHWVEAGRVYREDGVPPETWEDSVKDSWTKDQRTLWVSGMALGKRPLDAPPTLEDSLQAFTGPLIDQNGHWVRYQVVLNNVEFDYLVDNQLYNTEGQAKFTAKNKIEFPSNNGIQSYGAIELKFAWKQMGPNDDKTRFFVRRSRVLQMDGTIYEADFGLVGMHIAVRTESSPTWVWATFEHVDNTSVNDLEKTSTGGILRPSFFNPDNPTKPVNLLAPKNSRPNSKGQFTSWDEALTTKPTQVHAVLAIPKATAKLNDEARGLLKAISSKFQYYELIGTQWPVEPSFPAFPGGVAAQSNGDLLPSAPESILFKIPGKVIPVYMGNTTMETFFQAGNQVAGPLAEDDRLPPGQVADPSMVFGTESCAGCHFSAGACIGFKRDADGKFLVETRNGKNYRIPIYGKNATRGVSGNADYSWLLQLRAQSAPYQGDDVSPLADFLISGSD